MSSKRPVDYNDAVLKICKQLKIGITEIWKKHEAQSNTQTKFIYSLQVSYKGHGLQAFGTGSDKTTARMEASRKGLIQIVQRARMIGDPALCIKKCGLTEEDLSSSTDEQAKNVMAKAVDKLNSANKTKPEAVLKAFSSTTPQLVEFDYFAAVDRLKQANSIVILSELNARGIGEGEFTFLLEVCHNDQELQAIGSATSKKKAEKVACKNALIEMWLCNPALSLDECGLTEQDLTGYKRCSLQLDTKQQSTSNRPIKSTASSPTSQPGKFNYLAVVNQLRQIDGSFTFKELTDQSSISGLETKSIFVLQINHLGTEVYAFGSGPSKTKARAEACKAALVKLVYRLELSNPGLALDLASYGVTESDLAEYERCPDKQANDSIAKTVLSVLTQTENAESPADQAKQEAKYSAEALSVENAPTSKKPINLALPSISSSNQTGDDQKSTDKTPINCADLTAETLQNFGHSAKHSSALELALQVVLEKVEETIQDGHRFLKQNQDVFELLKRQEEDASRCYKTLIKRIIELSEDKLRYRFSLVDRIGFGQLFYEDLCIRTVSESCSQAASSCPDLIALEESCAKRMFDFVKLNCLG